MDDSIPISSLQHYINCPRQCALIHVEQTYAENVYTLRGNRLHERVDEPTADVVDGVRIERALPLFSTALGLTGKADVVEFREDGAPYPIEYKAGTRKLKDADDVQLCAQGMCLEEMLGREVHEGSIYYGRTRRRRVVSFDDGMRERVVKTIEAVRKLFTSERLPEPVADSRCRHCSLIDACMPYALKNYGQGGWRDDIFEIRGDG